MAIRLREHQELCPILLFMCATTCAQVCELFSPEFVESVTGHSRSTLIRVIHNFGRTGQLNRQRLVRLRHYTARVCKVRVA